MTRASGKLLAQTEDRQQLFSKSKARREEDTSDDKRSDGGSLN